MPTNCLLLQKTQEVPTAKNTLTKMYAARIQLANSFLRGYAYVFPSFCSNQATHQAHDLSCGSHISPPVYKMSHGSGQYEGIHKFT